MAHPVHCWIKADGKLGRRIVYRISEDSPIKYCLAEICTAETGTTANVVAAEIGIPKYRASADCPIKICATKVRVGEVRKLRSA